MASRFEPILCLATHTPWPFESLLLLACENSSFPRGLAKARRVSGLCGAGVVLQRRPRTSARELVLEATGSTFGPRLRHRWVLRLLIALCLFLCRLVKPFSTFRWRQLVELNQFAVLSSSWMMCLVPVTSTAPTSTPSSTARTHVHVLHERRPNLRQRHLASHG